MKSGIVEALKSSTNSIFSAPFDKTSEGKPVEIYALRNSNGMEARIMTYGGALVSLTAPDRDGQYADVVLGYDNLDEIREASWSAGPLALCKKTKYPRDFRMNFCAPMTM